MLSRIAESLFWIGRYVERADDTARILDVQTQLLIEDPGIDVEASCAQLLAVMGVEDETITPSPRTIVQKLAYDPESPTSIIASVNAARESARRARETLSTDIWEAINTMWRGLPATKSMRPPDMFAWIRQRASIVSGIADATMPRDEGWQFLVLGRSIERVDMTARLLSTAALSPGPHLAWPTTLRACGAYEAFLRAYRGVEADRQAAEFLLLDRLFPRSIVYSLGRAEQALENLEATGNRTGFSSESLRLLGRTRAELEYQPLSDIVSDLPFEMARVQRTCVAATNEITGRYFSAGDSMTWAGVSR